MNRLPLALLLALCASAAMAVEPVPVDGGQTTCEKSAAEREAEPVVGAAKPAKRPGSVAPVRTAGPSRSGTPRWNSLLPGMFR